MLLSAVLTVAFFLTAFSHLELPSLNVIPSHDPSADNDPAATYCNWYVLLGFIDDRSTFGRGE